MQVLGVESLDDTTGEGNGSFGAAKICLPRLCGSYLVQRAKEGERESERARARTGASVRATARERARESARERARRSARERSRHAFVPTSWPD